MHIQLFLWGGVGGEEESVFLCELQKLFFIVCLKIGNNLPVSLSSLSDCSSTLGTF